MREGRRVLLVRPLAQAERSAAALRALGYLPVVAPVLAVVDTAEPVPRILFDALVVTSTNAVPRLAKLAPEAKRLPVFAVGPRTAQALRDGGWSVAHEGNGSAADLARAVAATLPAGARLLHVTGRDRTGEPARTLTRAGATVSEWESYAAEPVQALPEEVAAELAGGALSGALHYSRRSADVLLALVGRAGMTDAFAKVPHLCLSAEIASSLAGLDGARVSVAAEPNEAALFRRLTEVATEAQAVMALPCHNPDAKDGTNPGEPPLPDHHEPSRAMSDNEPDMRPTGPYKRQPPTIDMKTGDYRAVSDGTAPTSEETVAAAWKPIADEPLSPEPHAGPAAPAGNATRDPVLERDPVPAAASNDAAAAASEPATTAASEGPAGSSHVAETEPATSPLPGTPDRTEAPPPRRGTGSLLAASLLGGVVGAALAVGGETYLHPQPSDLDARLAAVEARTRSAPAAGDAAAGLDKRIASLEASTKDLAGRVTDAKAAADAAVAQAGAASGAGQNSAAFAIGASPARSGPDPETQDALAKLGERVGALEAAGKDASKSNQDMLARLGDRLAAVETMLKAAPTAEAVGEIRTGLQALQTSSDDRLKSNTAALGALQSTTASLEGRIKDVSDQLGRLPPALMLAGLRVVAAGQAGQNLRAGVPLRPALAALGRLGAPPATLEPLNPFADQPAPSAATLLAEFKPLAERMTAEPTDANASFGDRLLHIADKIVTVRAVGDRTGNDLPGLIGRIQTSLEGGNLPDAAAAWDRLPDPARNVSADWAKRLKARAAADGAAGRIAADALSALQAPSQ